MEFFGNFAWYRYAFPENMPLCSMAHSSSKMTSFTSPYLPSLYGKQVYKFKPVSYCCLCGSHKLQWTIEKWFGIKTTTLPILATCHSMGHMWTTSKCAGSLYLSVATTRNLPRAFHDVLHFRFSTWFSIVSFMLPASSFHTNRIKLCCKTELSSVSSE